MKGKELEFDEYERLIPGSELNKKSHFVTCADYVTTSDGTGIVHTAPVFGEDDYQTGRRYGLPYFQPVDERGCYSEGPWAGRFVMDDDLAVDIVKYLGGGKQALFQGKHNAQLSVLLEMRHAAHLLLEAELVYRDEQAQGRTCGKQQYCKLVP